jgi:hypothetical protein
MICSERSAEAATNDYVRFPSHNLNLALSSHDGNFKILIGNKTSLYGAAAGLRGCHERSYNRMTRSIHWHRHLPIANNYFFGDDVHAAEQHKLRRPLGNGPLRHGPCQPASDRRPARYPRSTRNRTSGSRFGWLAWSCSVQTGHYGHKKRQRM